MLYVKQKINKICMNVVLFIIIIFFPWTDDGGKLFKLTLNDKTTNESKKKERKKKENRFKTMFFSSYETNIPLLYGTAIFVVCKFFLNKNI